MLNRADPFLMDLINHQLARPTGHDGLEAFRPLGCMIRGIDTWDANRASALSDLRAYAREGILDLHEFLAVQPSIYGCTPEEFILGYRPVLSRAVPKEHLARLEAWYRCLGTVFAWLDVPQGADLSEAIADRFQKDVGGALTELGPILVPAQEAWSRIKAHLG